MGRLENFIPIFNKVRIQSDGYKTTVALGANVPFPVEEDLVPFLKQINGHLSLKEIFSFLNRKSLPIHFEKSLELLKLFASRDYLQNSKDYLNSYNPSAKAKASKPNPNLNNLSHSYFSKERLIGLIQKTTLFSKCERSTAENILNHSSLESVQEGITLLKDQTTSSEFYILLAGEVGVYKEGSCLANLTPLSVFGESAAVLDQERNADVICTSPCWVLKIDASQLVDTQSPESFDSYSGLKSRLILNQTLASNPLFQSVPSDILQIFVSQCRIEKYAKEQNIIEQGETSGDFYFILNGSVAVIKDGIPVTSLSEGDHFGEVAALFHEPRTASILTEVSSTFLVLNQKSLFEVLCSHFRLAIAIGAIAQERKHSTSNVLNLFEDTFVPARSSDTTLSLEIDESFLETTGADLDVIDFTDTGNKVS